MPHPIPNQKYFLKQKIDYLEAIANAAGFGCCEQSNMYSVIDEEGKVAFTAVEKSSCFCRCCCNPNHKFQLNLYEGKWDGKENTKQVLTMYHPFKWPACCPICFDCQRGELIVYDGAVNAWENDEEGTILSHAKQPVCGGGFRPQFDIWDGKADDEKEPAYVIRGPCCCIGGICGDFCCLPTFGIFEKKELEADEPKPLSEIKKDKPDGLGAGARELLTDADNFTINLPGGSNDNTKAAIFASSLLIDYLFFEEGGNIYCDMQEQQLVCVCTNFYCGGCLCPCTCRFGGKQEEEN